MKTELERLPVIVGVAEMADRPPDAAQGKEPATLMAESVRAADAHGLLPFVDSLDVVKVSSWPYDNLPARLSRELGISPPRAEYGEGSGSSPVMHVHQAALRIARGESEVAVVCGAEAQHSVDLAKKQGVALPWRSEGHVDKPFQVYKHAHPVAVKYGLITPAHIYPLYENASTAAWGWSPRQSQARTGALWSSFSRVAAENPTAWLGKFHSAEEIVTVTPKNRPIAWPFTKFMVAQPSVNQGAAVLLTSLERARKAGVPAEQITYVWGGAEAKEPLDYIMRDRFDRSAVQDFVLRHILQFMGWERSRFDFTELYSCFPCVPKMAMRTLGMPEGEIPTVTGGLTFSGAPVHNFMTHALVNLVRRLRTRPDGIALAYGQGGHVTKHHGLVLASAKPPQTPAQEYSVQGAADRSRERVPPLLDAYEGPLRMETHTVVFARDGTPEYGVVVGRTREEQRVLCRVARSDTATLDALMNLDRSPIGSWGKSTLREGLNHWTAG